MIDFMLSIFSSMLSLDMRDHHDIPFALPLLMACFVGGIIGFTIIRFIGNEQKEDAKATATTRIETEN
jgi:Na+/H+ antiporter NhaA